MSRLHNEAQTVKLGAFVKSVWRTLDSWTNWLALSRIRNSFLSRALSAISLTALILANAPDFLERTGVDLLSVRLVFFGSAVFLLGYIFFGLWAPPEFRQPGEIHDHVRRMQDIANDRFVKSRLAMAKSLLERASARRRMGPPEGAVKFLSEEIEIVGNMKDGASVTDRVGLFHADLTLRQYDAPLLRLVIAAAMFTGIICLIFPTTKNIAGAIGSG